MRSCPSVQAVSRGPTTTDPSVDSSVGSTIRRLVLPVYSPVFLIQVGSGMLLPILPVALKNNDLSYQTITTILAAAGVGALLAQIPVGRILNHRSENQVMVACAAALALAIALLGLAGSAPLLMLLRFIAGAGVTGWLLSRQTFITRTVSIQVRGRAMSLFGGLNRVAFLIGPLIGGFVAERFGFAPAFLLAGAFTAAGIGPLLLDKGGWSLPQLPESEVAIRAPHPLAVFSRHRWVLIKAGSAQMCIIAVRYGRFIILPLTGEAIGLRTDEIGVLVAVGSAADMALFPLAGYLMDRFGRLVAIVPSFSLMGIGLLVLAGSQTYTGIVLSATVIGVGNGLGSGTMMTLSSDLAPLESPGEFLAALGTIRELGRIVGPIGLGYLADRQGLSSASVAMAVVAFVGVAVMVLGVGETSGPNRTGTGSKTSEADTSQGNRGVSLDRTILNR